MGLEALAEMEYPGRFIILGLDKKEEHIVGIYGVTGRSESSQARRMVEDRVGSIRVEPTDMDKVSQGDVDLLVYTALIAGKCLAISNGRQTRSVFNSYVHLTLRGLKEAHVGWSYEPDEPNYTPRISGLADAGGAHLSIIKRGSGGWQQHEYFNVPLEAGKGLLIATYTGVNVNPLPSFVGGPLGVDLAADGVQEQVELVYDSLAPIHPKDDFRVAVAGVYLRVNN